MVIKITPNDKGNPAGKLAEAELHFTEGTLPGAQARWIRHLGAAFRRRPQRHLSRAQATRSMETVVASRCSARAEPMRTARRGFASSFSRRSASTKRRQRSQAESTAAAAALRASRF